MPRNRKNTRPTVRGRTRTRKKRSVSRQIIAGKYFLAHNPGVYRSMINNAVEFWVPAPASNLTASSNVVSTVITLGSTAFPLPLAAFAQVFAEYVVLEARITIFPQSITDNGYILCALNEKDATAIDTLAKAEATDAFPIMLNQGGGQNALRQFTFKVTDYVDLEYADTDSTKTVAYLKFYADGVTLVGLGASEQVARVKTEYLVRFRGRNNETATFREFAKQHYGVTSDFVDDPNEYPDEGIQFGTVEHVQPSKEGTLQLKSRIVQPLGRTRGTLQPRNN